VKWQKNREIGERMRSFSKMISHSCSLSSQVSHGKMELVSGLSFVTSCRLGKVYAVGWQSFSVLGNVNSAKLPQWKSPGNFDENFKK